MKFQLPPVPPKVAALLSALAVLLVGGTVVVTLTVDDADHRTTIEIGPKGVPVPTAVAVDGPDRNVQPDTALKLNRPARALYRQAVTAPQTLDVAGNLRGPDPTPVATLDPNEPLASPSFPGCKTRMLPTNWSNRTSSVRGIAIHYTAGGNLPGLADMNGLTAYASSASAGVSWHFLIDAEGNCYYSVPLDHKAWAIAGLNSQTVNIEVVGRGSEPRFPAGSAGAAKLREVVQRLGRVEHVPMRLGATNGHCVMTGTGIITHWMGGPCSGGHIDIKPYSITAVVRMIQAGPKPITAAQRERCGELNRLRAYAKRHGWRSPRLERANAIKAGETRNRLRCLYPPRAHRLELVRV